MLNGVDHVAVRDLEGDGVTHMRTDGRAYMWENGAVTVYAGHRDIPWVIIPPNRVIEIIGAEHG